MAYRVVYVQNLTIHRTLSKHILEVIPRNKDQSTIQFGTSGSGVPYAPNQWACVPTEVRRFVQ